MIDLQKDHCQLDADRIRMEEAAEKYAKGFSGLLGDIIDSGRDENIWEHVDINMAHEGSN